MRSLLRTAILTGLFLTASCSRSEEHTNHSDSSNFENHGSKSTLQLAPKRIVDVEQLLQGVDLSESPIADISVCLDAANSASELWSAEAQLLNAFSPSFIVQAEKYGSFLAPTSWVFLFADQESILALCVTNNGVAASGLLDRPKEEWQDRKGATLRDLGAFAAANCGDLFLSVPHKGESLLTRYHPASWHCLGSGVPQRGEHDFWLGSLRSGDDLASIRKTVGILDTIDSDKFDRRVVDSSGTLINGFIIREIVAMPDSDGNLALDTLYGPPKIAFRAGPTFKNTLNVRIAFRPGEKGWLLFKEGEPQEAIVHPLNIAKEQDHIQQGIVLLEYRDNKYVSVFYAGGERGLWRTPEPYMWWMSSRGKDD